MKIKKFKEPNKVKRCVDCHEPGVIVINGKAYCSNCSDGVLIRTIKQCITAIELAEIKISIKPSMQAKKAYEEPKAGIFYLIPDPKTGNYDLYSEFEEPGNDVTHLFLWDKVAQKLAMRFKINAETVSDYYRGLPRGRIIGPNTKNGNWIVAHGKDFPMGQYKQEILSEFGMGDADSIGHVVFEYDLHETMLPRDKTQVEKALKIDMTPQGFKKSQPKRDKS